MQGPKLEGHAPFLWGKHALSLCGGFPSAEIGVPSTDFLRLCFQACVSFPVAHGSQFPTRWQASNLGKSPSRDVVDATPSGIVSRLSRIRTLRLPAETHCGHGGLSFGFASHGTRRAVHHSSLDWRGSPFRKRIAVADGWLMRLHLKSWGCGARRSPR